MTETEAIRARYARRSPSPPDLAIHEERNRVLDEFLDRLSSNRKTARVLDVGCGSGRILSHLLRRGFESQNLTGIDLLEDRLAAARRNLPEGVRFVSGDFTEMEFESQKADLVLAFTVFSSLLDSSYRKTFADRLWSATQTGGGILVYDFCVNNPLNKDVRAITCGELRRLFPAAKTQVRKLTLAPPLARAFPKLYKPLSRLPFLRTHMLCWLEKPAP